MDKVLQRLKDLKDEESRYAYADAVTNAFLAGQIKELREERDLTQEQLAALIGTKQSGISRWLNTGFSTCKVETLRKFARAYGVRLQISFEEFGTLPADIGGFTKKRLAPRKFEDDPAFTERDKADMEAVSAYFPAACIRRAALTDAQQNTPLARLRESTQVSRASKDFWGTPANIANCPWNRTKVKAPESQSKKPEMETTRNRLTLVKRGRHGRTRKDSKRAA